MNNKAALKRTSIRLYQFGLQALSLYPKLCIDPEATNENQVGFFIRTKQGKPDRTDDQINKLVSSIENKYIEWDGLVATEKKAKAKRKKVEKVEEVIEAPSDELLN